MSDDVPVEGPPRRGGPGRRHNAERGQRAASIVRGNDALRLRMAGLTFAEIADRLAYSDRATAARAVERALRRDTDAVAEIRDEYRRLTLARLERLVVAFWPKAMRGNVRAAATVIKALADEARLLGLDPPAPVALPQTASSALDAIVNDLERLILDADSVAS